MFDVRLTIYAPLVIYCYSWAYFGKLWRWLKPKFHYTDFATFSETSNRGQKSWKSRHKSCRRLLCRWLCRRLSPSIV